MISIALIFNVLKRFEGSPSKSMMFSRGYSIMMLIPSHILIADIILPRI